MVLKFLNSKVHFVKVSKACVRCNSYSLIQIYCRRRSHQLEVDYSLLNYPISNRAKFSSDIHWQKSHSHSSNTAVHHAPVSPDGTSSSGVCHCRHIHTSGQTVGAVQFVFNSIFSRSTPSSALLYFHAEQQSTRCVKLPGRRIAQKGPYFPSHCERMWWILKILVINPNIPKTFQNIQNYDSTMIYYSLVQMPPAR